MNADALHDMPSFVCRECGLEENPNQWLGGKKLLEKKLCLKCEHWTDLLARKDEPTTVRIDGVHYVIGEEGGNPRWAGFGGSEFKIRFDDGREVVTHNLWCQGHIAEHFKARMRDNAVFVAGMGAHTDGRRPNRKELSA